MDEKLKNSKLSRHLAEELRNAEQRPSWESSNEGVHERVNFNDTIWGFNLAGGAYYNTPLRVTQVKENSRAEYAGIKVGDMLTSVNDIDTSTLTVQEAHDIILASGIAIRLAFRAPDVDETTYSVYQDKNEQEMKEAKIVLETKKVVQSKQFTGAKVNDSWSAAWPCNKKRDITYRESNCCHIRSKYEEKHPYHLCHSVIKRGCKALETSD